MENVQIDYDVQIPMYPAVLDKINILKYIYIYIENTPKRKR